MTAKSTALCIQVSDSYISVQVVSPVPGPAASSHISAGGLEPASCLPADLANTTQKDLAVFEHGVIWTGVTQFRLCHNIKYAQYTLQCMLVGCMGASFNAAQVLVGNNFWVMEGAVAGPFQACHRRWNGSFLPLASTITNQPSF